jgi:hypothetical protein
MMQELFGIPIPYFVLVLELFIVIVLMVGWIYGARRMDFNLHHKAVWLVALAHFLTVGFWMIPRALERLTFMLANPIANWYQILHDVVGILAIGLGVVLVLLFLVKTGMPLKLLKRTRSLMFLTIGTWIIAFILGFYWFLLSWVIV